MEVYKLDISKFKTEIKYGREVLGPSGTPGAYDENAVDSPFVFWHNNKYYMLHIGFDGIGYQTALAVSTDLLHWEKEAVLFPRETLSGWDQGGIAGNWILRENDLYGVPRLKKVDGKYWMVYHSYPNKGYEAGPAQIGLAYTTDETLHQWNRLPDPILTWKDGSSWEKAGLYKGCMIEANSQYYLFYNAKNSENWIWNEQIGVAVSDDMLNWKRLSDEPIICNTSGKWDSYFCADPCVVRSDNYWIMFYYGYDGNHAQDGMAYSEDLIHWKKVPYPILSCGQPGEIDELHAHKPDVISNNGRLYHFYCAVRPGKTEDKAYNLDPTQSEGSTLKEYRCITVAMGETNKWNKKYLIDLAEKINDYWIKEKPEVGNCSWERAAYFLGNLAAYEITGRQDYLKFAQEWARQNQWKYYYKPTDPNYTKDNYMTCADYLLCGEIYAELMDKYGTEGTDEFIIRDLEKTLKDPNNDYWWWIDTIYMALNFYNIMGERQSNMRYAEKVYKLFYNSAVERKCYDTEAHLWFRDENFLPDRLLTKGGKKVFWARGNGWVFAGLARTLENISKEHPYYDEYKKIFCEMSDAIKDTQLEDGFWRTSMLEPEEYPEAETSGTVLFVLGYLKGIRLGILDKDEFYETAVKGFEGLLRDALTEEGRLYRVQGVAGWPGPVDVNNSNDYAVGTMLQVLRELVWLSEDSAWD